MHRELTVYEALDYAATAAHAGRHQRRGAPARIEQVLRELDLDQRKDLPIHKLSGGQRKRVSIGIELLTRPRLFFLDEATSGLDPGTELELMKLLRQLTEDPNEGRTIVLITHATKNVMLCDKVIFLTRGGYLAFYGPPDEALQYFDQYRSQEARQAQAGLRVRRHLQLDRSGPDAAGRRDRKGEAGAGGAVGAALPPVARTMRSMWPPGCASRRLSPRQAPRAIPAPPHAGARAPRRCASSPFSAPVHWLSCGAIRRAWRPAAAGAADRHHVR